MEEKQNSTKKKSKMNKVYHRLSTAIKRTSSFGKRRSKDEISSNIQNEKRNFRDAAPILRVEKTGKRMTYYISFIFILYFLCSILYDTLSDEQMTIFEVCIF